ncbi:hypothetical protein L4D09_21235 [Photobacterium makurazakiensis]|uniref:hypothetical protein n=1 Tax=Photobacterium makurazakiensis TaxID=2910234 RepID=UPI003D14219C
MTGFRASKVSQHVFIATFVSAVLLTPNTSSAAQEDVPYCHRYMDFNFPDYMALWNYDEPALTATTFFAMLNMASNSVDKTFYSELLSQIARTFVMRESYDDARHFLDQAELYLENAEPRAEVYYLREKARLFAATDKSHEVEELLIHSWQIADKEKYDQLAIETALDLSELAGLSQVEKGGWRGKAQLLADITIEPRAQKWVTENAYRFL